MEYRIRKIDAKKGSGNGITLSIGEYNPRIIDLEAFSAVNRELICYPLRGNTIRIPIGYEDELHINNNVLTNF